MSPDDNFYISFHNPETAGLGTRKEEEEENKEKLPTYQDQQKPAWNKQFLAFRIMSAPYFRESRSSRCLLAGITVLAFLNSAVRVLFSYLVRDFWSALSDKDVDEFYHILVKFLAALICLAPINVIYSYQRQRLAIYWREWMTKRTLQLYYSNRVYYKLERNPDNEGNDIRMDNPDQRIAEDVRSFTVFSLSFFSIPPSILWHFP